VLHDWHSNLRAAPKDGPFRGICGNRRVTPRYGFKSVIFDAGLKTHVEALTASRFGDRISGQEKQSISS